MDGWGGEWMSRGGVALILFFDGIRHLQVDVAGVIFSVFSEVFGYALLIHFPRPVRICAWVDGW